MAPLHLYLSVCELEVRREEGREQRGDKGREGKRKVGTWYIY